MKRNLLTLVALLGLTLSFTACKKKEVTGTSYIQITNVSEVKTPFNFFIDDQKVTPTALEYTQSTSYLSVASGEHQAAIKNSVSGLTVEAFQITPQPGLYYSVFHDGSNTIAYVDDVSAPATGKAKVRFVNFNIGYLTSLDFGITNGTKLVTALASKFTSDYVSVDPGVSLSAYATGSTTVLKTLDGAITAGHIYTVYLSGQDEASLKINLLLQK